MKSYNYSLLLLILLIGLIFVACKKDEQEDVIIPEQKAMQVFITNSPQSNVYITAIEVRIDNGEWSESIMPIGQAMFPTETQDYYINIPLKETCHFRLGVFSDSLHTSMLHLQEHWSEYNYPYLMNHGESVDSISLIVHQNQYTGFVTVREEN